MRLFLRSFLLNLAILLVLAPKSYGLDRNDTIINPTPDRTWARQRGGIFSSAKSYAVVVSISDYIGTSQGGFRALNTHNDSTKMVDFLIKDLGFDYVRVLTDRAVTKKNIEKLMLDEIRTLVGPEDRFLFYWSGHGTQIQRNKQAWGFLPLFDSKTNEFSSMISMDDIARWNGYLEARHALFILDACLSGLVGVNAKANPRLDQLTLPARFLITAGRAEEEAIVADRWGGSLFTDAFINVAKQYTVGLRGDPISIYRLFDDIQQRVAVEKDVARWQRPLTPQLKDLQGGGGAFFFAAARSQPERSDKPEKLGSEYIIPKSESVGHELDRDPPPPDPIGWYRSRSAPGNIDIRALADCWVQIRNADQSSVVFSRVMKAGEVYRVPRPGLMLRTGNAGALEVLVDGKPAPSIGGPGMLRRAVALDPEALRAGTAVR